MLIEDDLDRLVMVPGPTPVHRTILHALAEPTLWHSSDAMARIVLRCQEGIRKVVHAQDARVFIFGGSGTLAQEAAIVNLVAPGERLVVASNGFFGDRFAAIGEAHGIQSDRVAARWGSSVTADELGDALRTRPARAVTITHVDTSTGTAAPIADLIKIAKSQGAFTVLDSVCGLGGMPVDMSALGVDVVLSGAQKALGVPPGLAILAVSEVAMRRRKELGRIASYYADLSNWEASMESPQTYFSTHAVNLFYALARALDLIDEEGLDARYARHERQAAAFRAGMGAVGFRPFTEKPYLAPTLSVLEAPEGLDVEGYRLALAHAGVVAAPNLGELKGRGLRFGHMGNITESDILRTLGAAEAALESLGIDSTAGLAVGAGARVLRRDPAPVG